MPYRVVFACHDDSDEYSSPTFFYIDWPNYEAFVRYMADTGCFEAYEVIGSLAKRQGVAVEGRVVAEHAGEAGDVPPQGVEVYLAEALRTGL